MFSKAADLFYLSCFYFKKWKKNTKKHTGYIAHMKVGTKSSIVGQQWFSLGTFSHVLGFNRFKWNNCMWLSLRVTLPVVSRTSPLYPTLRIHARVRTCGAEWLVSNPAHFFCLICKWLLSCLFVSPMALPCYHLFRSWKVLKNVWIFHIWLVDRYVIAPCIKTNLNKQPGVENQQFGRNLMWMFFEVQMFFTTVNAALVLPIFDLASWSLPCGE